MTREGVWGVYALYYTHRGGIFNTTCDWLKSSKRAGSAALKSQLFLVERSDSLQACAFLHPYQCFHSFTAISAKGCNEGLAWIAALLYWILVSSWRELWRTLQLGRDKQLLEACSVCQILQCKGLAAFGCLRCLETVGWPPVCDVFPLLLTTAWKEGVAQVPGCVFMHPQWLGTVCRAHGLRESAREGL